MKKILPFMVVGILVLSGLGAVAINVEKESNAEPIDTENQDDPRDYTHTVLVEAGMRSGCPACPATNAAWKSIYAGGQYDFEYVGLIYQQNSYAYQRFYSFNPAYVPTSYWDGGQYVYVGTNTGTFKSYLDAAGSRSVPDLVGEVSAEWEGDAKIDISISVENNDNQDYPGTLRVYVVELVSRWKDYNNQPYGHALLAFPWQQTITIDAGDTFEDSKIWDGAAAGYGDIEPDNIQVILTMSDDTPHQSYSDPPSGNPFDAYYVDMTVATLVAENQPPNKPTVSGPTDVEPGIEYEYSFVATDPEDEDLRYWIDWGDSTQGWLGPFPSGETQYITHAWPEVDVYEVKAMVKDENSQDSEWSDPLTVSVGNVPPEKPVITGPPSGGINTVIEFTFVSTDRNGHDIKYVIDWGDGDTGETAFAASGVEVSASHSWNEEKTFLIKAKAVDEEGGESDWGTETIHIPRNKAFRNIFLSQIFERFTQIFQTLRQLLR